jgi:phosphoheptose isomerase
MAGIHEFSGEILDYNKALYKALLEVKVDRILQAACMLEDCKGIVWLMGNGGSLALASHMATDLQLAGVSAQALSDSVAMSSYANDTRYSQVFYSQLSRSFKKGDILVFISTSGESRNLIAILDGIRTAPNNCITLTGKDGGKLKSYGTNIHISSQNTGIVQDIHQIVLHQICHYLKDRV